ncbi:MAG: VOC family protein [Phycisphaeraceae bacterium]|nr:VOC family protein [Phycisphaeraceae bacterium]
MAIPLITGIHHVTALASSPRGNLDFYTRVLGMRFIKRTVNHDDPMTYHLYYADGVGSPGSVLTHFPHPHAARASHGTGEIRRTVLAVPVGSMGYWIDRLEGLGITAISSVCFDRPRLEFTDPDGMELAIAEDDVAEVGEPWEGHGVPDSHAVRTVDTTTLRVPDVRATGQFLIDALGFVAGNREDDRQLFTLHDGGPGQRLELIGDRQATMYAMGAGTVHHVAWRVPDEQAQKIVSDRLFEANTPTTPIIDRLYFRSIYFRIPGRVIFEVATDGPGFDADEALEDFGRSLKLPPQHEPRRNEIEAHLEPLD